MITNLIEDTASDVVGAEDSTKAQILIYSEDVGDRVHCVGVAVCDELYDSPKAIIVKGGRRIASVEILAETLSDANSAALPVELFLDTDFYGYLSNESRLRRGSKLQRAEAQRLLAESGASIHRHDTARQNELLACKSHALTAKAVFTMQVATARVLANAPNTYKYVSERRLSQ